MADDLKSKPRKDLRILTFASVASVCINIAMVVVLSHSKEAEIMRERMIGQRIQDLKSSICTSCHVFGKSHDGIPTNGITRLSLQNESLCCVDDAESLIKLIKIMVMRSYMKGPELGDQPMPSAHLYLDTLTDNNYTWTDEFGFGAGHVTKNLEFKNGRFYVKKSGLYNIYSLITFKQDDGSASSVTIRHSVRKLSPISKNVRSVPVLEGTMDLSAQSHTFMTSYLSGFVRLEAFDELYVDVSHISLIYRYAPANFIGLHFLEEAKERFTSPFIPRKPHRDV